ncbi:MAG TPA: hypothetical protein VGI44_03200, partial [Acidimicrobiales bacterium]
MSLERPNVLEGVVHDSYRVGVHEVLCPRPPDSALQGDLAARAEHHVVKSAGGTSYGLLEEFEEPRSHDPVDHYVIAALCVAG